MLHFNKQMLHLNTKQTFTQTNKKRGDECNYRLCVEAMRIYMVQYLLPPDMASSYAFQKRSAEGNIVHLMVEMHPLREQPTIQRFVFSEKDKVVGVVGVWHHGIEELFSLQKIQGQMISRSLRHRNDDIVERSLYWLCIQLLRWGEHD